MRTLVLGGGYLKEKGVEKARPFILSFPGRGLKTDRYRRYIETIYVVFLYRKTKIKILN